MNNTTICQHAKSEWGEPTHIEGLQQGVNTELTKHNCINSQKCGYCHCCGVESFLDSPFVWQHHLSWQQQQKMEILKK